MNMIHILFVMNQALMVSATGFNILAVNHDLKAISYNPTDVSKTISAITKQHTAPRLVGEFVVGYGGSDSGWNSQRADNLSRPCGL